MTSTIVSSSCAIRPVARVSSPGQSKATVRGLSSVKAVSKAVVFMGKQQLARASARSGKGVRACVYTGFTWSRLAPGHVLKSLAAL
eukprot:7456992-Pyramimonas_sp.AAC.1